MPKKPYTMRLVNPQTKHYNEFAEEFQAYNIARGLRQGTLDFYTSYIKIHRNYIVKILQLETNDFPLTVYDDRLVIDIINYMRTVRKVKDGAINTHMRFLSTITKFALSREYIKKAPKIIKVKQDRQVGETYLPWELELMLMKPDMKKSTFIPYRNWVLCCFLFSTGARLSSVVNVKAMDVDINKRTVRLSHTKNRQGQILPITPKLLSILNEYLEIRKGVKDDYLFCDYSGNQLSGHAIEQAIEQHNRSRGIQKHGIHSFRRTFATQAIRLGMSAFELQALLGHSSIDMVSRYVKAVELDLPTSVTRYNPLEHYELSKEKSIFINK